MDVTPELPLPDGNGSTMSLAPIDAALSADGSRDELNAFDDDAELTNVSTEEVMQMWNF